MTSYFQINKRIKKLKKIVSWKSQIKIREFDFTYLKECLQTISSIFLSYVINYEDCSYFFITNIFIVFNSYTRSGFARGPNFTRVQQQEQTRTTTRTTNFPSTIQTRCGIVGNLVDPGSTADFHAITNFPIPRITNHPDLKPFQFLKGFQFF